MCCRFLNQITVKDLQEKKEWHFICNKWLTPRKPDSLHQSIAASASNKDQPVRYKVSVGTYRSLREGHVIAGIFTRSPHSKFTRLQRATCALCFLCGTMLANIMYFGHNPETEDQVTDRGIQINFAAVKIGIQSALLTIPINLLFVSMFKTVKPKPSNLLIEPINDNGGVVSAYAEVDDNASQEKTDTEGRAATATAIEIIPEKGDLEDQPSMDLCAPSSYDQPADVVSVGEKEEEKGGSSDEDAMSTSGKKTAGKFIRTVVQLNMLKK